MTPATAERKDLEDLAVNTIRMLSVDAVEAANSGHPGLPMGAAEMGYVLFTRFLKFDPQNPNWADRDRFVLSAGHGSMFLYSLLHLSGYDLSLDELKNFRQLHSKTPGHPEYRETAGVETTTGPLGQGFANGVGMALAEALLAARYNASGQTIVDHYTYILASDGDLMEGISHEAASLAGHLKLGKLICLYDDNLISLDGPTELSFTEDVQKRFDAYGWQTIKVDGHDRDDIERAITAAQDDARPSLLLCRTTIGYGSPNKAGSSKCHGSPLGVEEVELTKKALGWSYPPFTVPEEVRPLFAAAAERGAAANRAWSEAFAKWKADHAESAATWERVHARQLPASWEERLPEFDSEKAIATRSASGQVINAVAATLPELVGGSADLASSNNTMVQNEDAVTPENFAGRNLWFGVREHAMGAIMSGMALHGGLRPYGGTFLAFSDYMRTPIRLAAMMRIPTIYVFTHDSIFLGEDGPTHQPVEQMAALRAIPNLTVVRPADANEVATAWSTALQRTDGPTALILTRQTLPITAETVRGKGSERGGYIIEAEGGGDPDAILLASGSEVSLARAAAAELREKGRKVRVVSLPSWDVFDAQPRSYRDEVLPPQIRCRLAIEAGSPLGWERYVGIDGAIVGMEGFGASAPMKELAKLFGFTTENVVATVERLLGN